MAASAIASARATIGITGRELVYRAARGGGRGTPCSDFLVKRSGGKRQHGLEEREEGWKIASAGGFQRVGMKGLGEGVGRRQHRLIIFINH